MVSNDVDQTTVLLLVYYQLKTTSLVIVCLCLYSATSERVFSASGYIL